MLNKARLESRIKRILETEAAKDKENDSPTDSLNNISKDLASAIVDEIKSMTIVIVGTAGNVPLTIQSVTIT